jgi:hypothetical protein
MNDLKSYVENLATLATQKEQERGITIQEEKKQRGDDLRAFQIVNEVKYATDSMPVEAKQIINTYINRLMMLKPSMKTQFKTEKEVLEFKREFAYQCFKHGINSKEKLDCGMEYASVSTEKWIDIGQFINWCKDGYNQNLKQTNLLNNTKRIMDERRQLGVGTFEERQAVAKQNLDELRKIIKRKDL